MPGRRRRTTVYRRGAPRNVVVRHGSRQHINRFRVLIRHLQVKAGLQRGRRLLGSDSRSLEYRVRGLPNGVGDRGGEIREIG